MKGAACCALHRKNIMRISAHLLIVLGVLLFVSSTPTFAHAGSTPSMAASLETPTRSRGSLSVGRFNSVLGLGAMTAYGVRRNNRTLMIGGTIASSWHTKNGAAAALGCVRR